MITGCHPGECHYIEQNYKALRRFLLLRRVIKGMGIEPERVKLVWASAAEGAKFASETTTFVEEIRKLGPLNWGKFVEQVPEKILNEDVISEPMQEEVPV